MAMAVTVNEFDPVGSLKYDPGAVPALRVIRTNVVMKRSHFCSLAQGHLLFTSLPEPVLLVMLPQLNSLNGAKVKDTENQIPRRFHKGSHTVCHSIASPPPSLSVCITSDIVS